MYLISMNYSSKGKMEQVGLPLIMYIYKNNDYMNDSRFRFADKYIEHCILYFII